MKITVGYPSVESELKILQEYHHGNNLHEVKFDKPVITLDELKQMRSMLTQVVVDDSLMKYLCNIVAATRDSTYTWIGGSPRASIALLQTAKAHAILSGRDFVTPDDIHFLAPYILAHRVTLTAEAELNGMTITQLVKQIIDTTHPLPLP
jgi:MoxR-like ATPase